MRRLFNLVLFAGLPGRAFAHAGEQGFVLLLPTAHYIWGGAAAVLLTAVIMAALPFGFAGRMFRPFARSPFGRPRLETWTSLAAAAVLAMLIWIGFNGPHDPAENLLPLTIWTLWWGGLVLVQAVFGNLWRFINPFSGPYALIRAAAGWRPPFRLAARFGYWPGLLLLFLFGCFYMADIAPSDPPRLAAFLALYWLATLSGMLLFGARPWLMRVEFATMLMGFYARLAPLRRSSGKLVLGLPGHAILAMRVPAVSAAIFMAAMLAAGSFDGLNETFWWLGLIGVNPLEFPGRSAVIGVTIAGLFAAGLLLSAAFAAAVWVGLALIGQTRRQGEAFRALAPALLPIALAYHFGHYLTLLLVNGQHFIAALSDPFDSGADLLGLGEFRVTTGFFNSLDSVRLIWMSQAGIIVAGHVLAILLSHAIAEKLIGDRSKALLSQLPLAIFMIAYTWFGLWLLAAPRGA